MGGRVARVSKSGAGVGQCKSAAGVGAGQERRGRRRSVAGGESVVGSLRAEAHRRAAHGRAARDLAVGGPEGLGVALRLTTRLVSLRFARAGRDGTRASNTNSDNNNNNNSSNNNNNDRSNNTNSDNNTIYVGPASTRARARSTRLRDSGPPQTKSLRPCATKPPLLREFVEGNVGLSGLELGSFLRDA